MRHNRKLRGELVRLVQVDNHGGPGVLRVREVESPPMRERHVRVQVAAAGVNFIDLHERSGAYPRQAPFVPGGEGSGRVVEMGEGVDEVTLGQRVAWQGVLGSYAEEVLVPSWQLIAVPDEVTDRAAAAFPVQGLTAHCLTTSAYAIKPGDTVVVHAGAGGLGLVLTQVAVALGAQVITTVSNPRKAEISHAAGAHCVTSYANLEDAVRQETKGQGAAAVYDSIGRDTFESSLGCLSTRGTMVLCGRSSGPVRPFDLERLGSAGSLVITRPTLRHFVATRSDLLRRSADVLRWIREGRLTLRLGGTYALEEAAAAHEAMSARRSTGKLLLIP